MIKERTVRIADNLILKLVRHTERGMIVMWEGMSDCRVFCKSSPFHGSLGVGITINMYTYIQCAPNLNVKISEACMGPIN